MAKHNQRDREFDMRTYPQDFVDKLAPLSKQVCVRRREGKPYRTIAADLDRSYGWVCSMCSFIRDRYQTYLEKRLSERV